MRVKTQGVRGGEFKLQNLSCVIPFLTHDGENLIEIDYYEGIRESYKEREQPKIGFRFGAQELYFQDSKALQKHLFKDLKQDTEFMQLAAFMKINERAAVKILRLFEKSHMSVWDFIKTLEQMVEGFFKSRNWYSPLENKLIASDDLDSRFETDFLPMGNLHLRYVLYPNRISWCLQ